MYDVHSFNQRLSKISKKNWILSWCGLFDHGIPQIIVPFHKGFLGFQTNGPQTNLPHESANFTERSLFLQPWAQPWDQWTTERAHLYPRTGTLWVTEMTC